MTTMWFKSVGTVAVATSVLVSLGVGIAGSPATHDRDSLPITPPTVVNAPSTTLDQPSSHVMLVCSSTATPLPPYQGTPVSSATVVRQVAHCADDAYERQDTAELLLAAPYVRMGGRAEGGNLIPYVDGLLFRDIRIPRGAEILAARLRLAPWGWQSGSPIEVRIAGDLRPQANEFVLENPLPSARPHTSAAVFWTLPGNVTTSVESPDISVVIEELLAQPGWQAGNNLAILIDYAGPSEMYVDWTAYDHDPENAAQLLISYGPSSTPTPTATPRPPTPTATPRPPTPTATPRPHTPTATPRPHTPTATPRPPTPTATPSQIASRRLYIPFSRRAATATPSPTPTPTPLPVIDNGGFESGFAAWSTGGSFAPPQIRSNIVRSGTRAAVLGNPDEPCTESTDPRNGDSWVTQYVLVPNTGTPELVVWYRIFTWDRNGGLSDELDRFEVWIDDQRVLRDANQTPIYGCGRPPTDLGWKRFNFDLSAYRGQWITLKLTNIVWPDEAYNTWTYVDDIDRVSPRRAHTGFFEGESSECRPPGA